MKASTIATAKKLSDILNIGPAMVRDLEKMNIKKPEDLKGKDGYKLYKKLCEVTGTHQDPCVLDTFLAVVDFAGGAPARPWWFYTKERKRRYGV